MKKIRAYMQKYWYNYLLILVCMLMAIGLDMLYPQITKIIVNKVFKGGDMELLPGLLLAIVLVGIGRSVFGYFKEFTADKTGAKIGAEMREELFGHIQGLSMDFFSRTNTGELMARVKDDIDHIWQVLGFIGMLIVEVTIHVLSVLYCMFHLNWKLAFVPVAFMVVCGAVAILLERKLDTVYEEISEENAELTTIAEENLAGVRTVKAFARERFEIDKFLSHNKRYYDLNMREAKTMVRYNPVFSFVAVLLPVTIAVLGGVLVAKGEMDIGSLVAYVEYSRNCTWPMETLGWLANSVSQAVASRRKVRRIFEQTSSVKEEERPVQLGEVRGNVEFSHVSFGIDDNRILEDVSFVLREGKTLGIMGATGSGKSSIVNLLQRFYDVNSGQVLMEGVDVRRLSLRQIRENISVVMQDVFLFSDTIRENIEMGRRGGISSEDIRAAARRAQASDFIEEMEEKYDTVIGERGVGLSGGQKQRISIARALSKKNPILVLDDSTSALDMETEHEIQKTLHELQGTTKIIIAHRISAVRHADEIIYLDNGRVAERGTHEELLAKKGLYYETYKVQYGA
ncbi:MAG: ABC transporter ATP-binding protein/permease [Muribaculaceae bacterium]|nr:ABC transporter ATP-binding protein/permease [Roseburia sp.]MCM1430668.1 ABC transporter ATP-binding protein/permease [Muribaculaceae bacterium]MCM1491935.1 ABC transporter ATP-binding protein/permease [Muribaculaceae bacterium]